MCITIATALADVFNRTILCSIANGIVTWSLASGLIGIHRILQVNSVGSQACKPSIRTRILGAHIINPNPVPEEFVTFVAIFTYLSIVD